MHEHDAHVFHAVDVAYKALRDRDDAPVAEWGQREAEVDKSFAKVRDAFSGQRKFVEREMLPSPGAEDRPKRERHIDQ
jgi:hypothetical protein